jgi:hypothetical protein
MFWGVTGCCGCLTVLLIAGGVGYLVLRNTPTLLSFAVKGPQDVVRAELDDIKGGRIDAAYDRLADDYKLQMSRSQFDLFLNAHQGLKANKTIDFEQNQIFNDTASLRAFVTSETGGKEEIRVELKKSGGSWKITLFEVWERTSRVRPVRPPA